MTNEQITLVRELRGTACECGRKKMTMQTFCRQCYHSLPEEVQKELYRGLGRGYEEAVDRARRILKG